MNIRDVIIKFMESKEYRPMLREELLIHFGIDKSESKEFYKVLEGLEKDGILVRNQNNRYGLLNADYLVVGKLEGHEKGFGFVLSKDKQREDVFITSENMNGAMNGDTVIANILKKSEAGKREEGEIIRILERGNKILVGTYEDNNNFEIGRAHV